MKLAELSERSGVSTATIKYYLREGLLPPGRRVTATRSAYDDSHLQRLRLVRALIQVGRVPVATAREVLAALEDDSLDHHHRLGIAVGALPGAAEPDPGAPAADLARHTVDALLSRLNWREGAHACGPGSPAYGTLVDAVGALARLNYPCAVDDLLPYARAAAELAVTDLDLVERYDSPDAQVEAAVALTVLYEPVLLSLRRIAEARESGRRFTSG